MLNERYRAIFIDTRCIAYHAMQTLCHAVTLLISSLLPTACRVAVVEASTWYRMPKSPRSSLRFFCFIPGFERVFIGINFFKNFQLKTHHKTKMSVLEGTSQNNWHKQ
jgi:hypothetical protein